MTANDRLRGAPDLLACGFGITAAMWAIGYVCRLPVVMAPSWIVALLLLAVPIAGGFVAGARGTRGVRGGLYAGLLAGLLNLLVLGAFLAGDQPNQVHPSAAIFVPGSIALMGLLAAAGAAWGVRSQDPARERPEWTSAFVGVGVGATFLLLVAGGLVTSNAAGLAVVDWPNSERYAMFLYPIARMTGGIYYEHAHRLLGSLVGLTTLAIAWHLGRVESRGWVKRLALAAFALVVVQGILGGLRVTGRFTLSSDPTHTEPNIYLAIAHGVLGQVFFSTMVALAGITSRAWKRLPAATPHRAAATDHRLGLLLVGLLLLQLTLGAVQRHLAHGLMIHLALAFVVAGLAAAVGTRAWGFHPDQPVLQRAGKMLLAVTALQLVLGFGAFVVVGGLPTGAVTGGWNIVVRTAHQGTGAILLATAVACAVWTRRLVAVEASAAVARTLAQRG
jgi:cytochrome c oxidase assembly protein subunit 15